jgi:hypothetical protein
MTEIDLMATLAADRLLREWAKHNTNIKVSGDWERVPARTNGGERWVLNLTYRDRPVTLEYALRDAEGYAHPRDIGASDIWLIHDTGGGIATDAQIWGELFKNRSRDKTQIMISENVVDFNPAADLDREVTYYLTLPLSGARIAGAYGCANFYPLRDPVSGLEELGTSDVRSALVADTAHPLIQALNNDSIARFVLSGSYSARTAKKEGLMWLAKQLL